MTRVLSFAIVLASILIICLVPKSVNAGMLIDIKDFGEPKKNYLQNSSFELPLKPQWYNFANYATEYRVQGNETHSGKLALRISGNNANDSRLNQIVDLKIGETYTLSAWLKSKNLKSLKESGDWIGVVLSDAGSYWHVCVKPEASTSGWKRYSVTFKTPPTTHYKDQFYCLQIYMPKGETGEIWVDDIQIERSSNVTNYTAKSIPDLRKAVESLNEANSLLNMIPNELHKLSPKTDILTNIEKTTADLKLRVEQAGKTVLKFENASDEKWEEALKLADESPRQVREMAWRTWWTNPWADYTRHQSFATSDPAEPNTLRLAVNDYAPLALMITNLTDGMLDVRARIIIKDQPVFRIDSPSWATLRQARMVVPVYEPGVEYPNVLAMLDESQTFSTGAGETSQLWIDIDTKGLKPGTYEATLELIPQQNLEPRLIPIRVEVLPLVLPVKCPSNVFCFGGNPFGELGENPAMSQEDINKLQDAWLHDLSKHGMNGIFHPNTYFKPEFAQDDSLCKPIDFTWHDKLLFSKQKYFDSFVGGYSITHYYMPETADAQFERRFESMLKPYIEHLKSLGFNSNNYMFELTDEPGGTTKLKNEVGYKILKRVAPDWKAMAAVTMNTPESLKDLSTSLDIMVVSPFLDESCDKFLRESGKEIWTYRCDIYLKNLHPYRYFRMLPWITWSKGYTGFGFTWSLRETGQPQSSPRDNYISQYEVGSNGPVPTRGWQAFWRGTRDWTYLSMLKDKISAAELSGRAEEAQKARNVLTKAVEEITTGQEDSALADKWRERILDQLLILK